MKPCFRSFHSAANTKLVSCKATHNLAKCRRCSRGFLRYYLPSALVLESLLYSRTLYIYRIRQNKKGCKGNFPYSPECAKQISHNLFNGVFRVREAELAKLICEANLLYSHVKSSGVTPLKLAAGTIAPDFTCS